MMDKVYNKDDKKDWFITERLLPYLMKHIEESDNRDKTIDAVAAMYIFPYRTSDGFRVGSLKEPGIRWYFTESEDKHRVSSDSYRIFAEEILKQDQLKKIKNVFQNSRFISKFSNNAVLEDLLERMSVEKDYTKLWWTCCYDVLKLWTPDIIKGDFGKATTSIISNCFLFDPNYKGTRLKKALIQQGIFKDILSPVARRCFWDRISRVDEKKALRLLKTLRVPCSFVSEKQEWTGMKLQTIKRIDPNILEFASNLGNKMQFPVRNGETGSGLCELSHDLFMDIIYNESKEAFMNALGPETADSYSKGITVRNIKGEYVPLSWHLFYSSEELRKDGSSIEEENKSEKLKDQKLEYLHIDVNAYAPEFIREYKNIHAFSDVSMTAENYTKNVNAIDFYRWVWSYSRHSTLAKNILWHFTGKEKERVTINKENNDFVLSVISEAQIEDEGYAFDIQLTAEEAFLQADSVNKIDSSFKNIYAVVEDDCQSFDVGQYVQRILAATYSSYSTKSKIEESEIWRHVYLVNEQPGLNYDIYLKCRLYHPDSNDLYEEALVLWPSTYEDSYVHALATYISAYYEVEINIEDAEDFNWKEEYIRLETGIRSFISTKTEKRRPEDLYGYTANMEDIENFGEEKRLWLNLRAQRKRIMDQKTGKSPVDFAAWRSFLNAKYTGRCQLCGGKTITGEQNAHFYTFRIIKESENQLANISSNMFCLCPSCWGEMGHGSFMGKDMHELLDKTTEYSVYLKKQLEINAIADHSACLVKEVFEEQDLTDEELKKLEGFHNPIVCRVMVNGKDRCMAFSWEHFIRLAFILSSAEDHEE